eukprot:1557332-Prymnesium_polylepis.1
MQPHLTQHVGTICGASASKLPMTTVSTLRKGRDDTAQVAARMTSAHACSPPACAAGALQPPTLARRSTPRCLAPPLSAFASHRCKHEAAPAATLSPRMRLFASSAPLAQLLCPARSFYAGARREPFKAPVSLNMGLWASALIWSSSALICSSSSLIWQLFEAIGALWCAAVDVGLESLLPAGTEARVPVTPLAGSRFWLPESATAPRVPAARPKKARRPPH